MGRNQLDRAVLPQTGHRPGAAPSHRVTAAADLDPDSGRARLSYEVAEQLFKHKQLATLQQYVKPSQEAVARLMAGTDPDRQR
jgi:hypothetical protein